MNAIHGTSRQRQQSEQRPGDPNQPMIVDEHLVPEFGRRSDEVIDSPRCALAHPPNFTEAGYPRAALSRVVGRFRLELFPDFKHLRAHVWRDPRVLRVDVHQRLENDP